MSNEYQDHCNANYGPDDEPTREEQEGDAWEYWHGRAMSAETLLHLIREREPASPATEFDSNLLSADEANKRLGEIFLIARSALTSGERDAG
jgi:hypothetical protein